MAFSLFTKSYSIKSLLSRQIMIRNMSSTWRFAPLRPGSKKEGNNAMQKLDGIIFDVDGTLCKAQNHMFKDMRDALGIDKSTDILDHIHSLPEDEQEGAQELIRNIERREMKLQQPQPGLAELMKYLDDRKIRKAINTRNFDEPVTHLLQTFIPETEFWPIINRTFKPPKPSPEGILHIAKSWSLPAQDRGKNLVFVGDSIDDMSAGSAAGSLTVLLLNEANAHLKEHESTDVCINRLDELIPILEDGHLP